VKHTDHKEIQELQNRVADGTGYGDPDARLNDDRKLQILLAQGQAKISARLNPLTFLLVIIGLINAMILIYK